MPRQQPRRSRLPALIAGFLAGLFTVMSAASAVMAAQAPLSSHQGLYPRAVRISHDAVAANNGTLVVSVTSFDGGGHEDIFASHDNGATFALAGTVNDAAFAKGLCCGGLYELPVAIGAMPAGTLLWSGSVGADTPADPMQLRIYKSTDQGATWSYLSNCATGAVPRSQGGLWEPEFTIAANGKLVCYYSDETVAGHSQVLKLTQSSDGVTWSAAQGVVVSSDGNDRPGMANVVRLPGGSYVMSFEMCGPLNCATYIKTSADGIDWGSATDHGSAVVASDGTTFWHTPTLAWAPVAGSTAGQLVLQGQILVKGGVVQPGNGKTIFINSAGDGTGDWTPFAAATTANMPAGTAGNYCQNYSTPLLPLDSGHKLLMVATDFDGTVCKAYYNVGALGGVSVTGGNLSVAKGSQATGDFTIRTAGAPGGSYTVAVSLPGIPADVTVSDPSVTLTPSGTATVHLTVKPTTLAMVESFFSDPKTGFGLLAVSGISGLLYLVFGGKAAVLALFAACATLLGGCGGGGSSGGGTTPTPVSTSYNGTLTVTSSADSSVTGSTAFVVTISKTV